MPELRLKTAEQLLDALNVEHAVVRLKVADAISHQPDRISAYGHEEARLIADALWGRLRLEREPAVRASLLRALGLLDDERLVARCSDILCDPEHTLAVEAAAILGSRDLSHLPRVIRIRAWLLSENRQALEASLGDVYVPDWVGELNGPLGSLARKRLAALGLPIVTLFAARGGDLCSASLAWLVSLSAEADHDVRHHLLQTAFAEGSREVVIAALAVCRAAFHDLPDRLRHRALEYVGHPDAKVRQASLLLPRVQSLLISAYEEESDSCVRATALQQLSVGDATGLAVLVAALSSDQWRERAAAVNAFVAGGPAVIEKLRIVYCEDEGESNGGVRSAARQALLRLGDDAWLRALPGD